MGDIQYLIHPIAGCHGFGLGTYFSFCSLNPPEWLILRNKEAFPVVSSARIPATPFPWTLSPTQSTGLWSNWKSATDVPSVVQCFTTPTRQAVGTASAITASCPSGEWVGPAALVTADQPAPEGGVLRSKCHLWPLSCNRGFGIVVVGHRTTNMRRGSPGPFCESLWRKLHFLALPY